MSRLPIFGVTDLRCDLLRLIAELFGSEGRTADTVTASGGADVDHRIPYALGDSFLDVIVFNNAHSHGVYQGVTCKAGVNHKFTAYGGDPRDISVASHAGYYLP